MSVVRIAMEIPWHICGSTAQPRTGWVCSDTVALSRFLVFGYAPGLGTSFLTGRTDQLCVLDQSRCETERFMTGHLAATRVDFVSTGGSKKSEGSVCTAMSVCKLGQTSGQNISQKDHTPVTPHSDGGRRVLTNGFRLCVASALVSW